MKPILHEAQPNALFGTFLHAWRPPVDSRTAIAGSKRQSRPFASATSTIFRPEPASGISRPAKKASILAARSIRVSSSGEIVSVCTLATKLFTSPRAAGIASNGLPENVVPRSGSTTNDCNKRDFNVLFIGDGYAPSNTITVKRGQN